MNKIATQKKGPDKRPEKHRRIEPAFASAAEAAVFLRISRGMVVKMIKAGEIPYCRFGRNFRIAWSWLHQQLPT